MPLIGHYTTVRKEILDQIFLNCITSNNKNTHIDLVMEADYILDDINLDRHTKDDDGNVQYTR